jgi:hypothetical protein
MISLWKNMNIILRYRGLNARPFLTTLVEGQLNRLQALTAIASARVSLEWTHEAKPRSRVTIWLEVPGHDYHAEARDHTIQAALLKVVKSLEE